MIDDHAEYQYWKSADPDELWAMDKLILSRKLGYNCGPAGVPVDAPGYYIVRPCVNAMGLGLGAAKSYIEKNTEWLDVGFFWCEWFEGRHLSVDYHYGKQELCVEGFKHPDTFTTWRRWQRVEDTVPLPGIIEQFKDKEWINCEFIGGKLIEVHFRHNPDFALRENMQEFIPVWIEDEINPPEGYEYVECVELHGRVGAYVK